MKFVKVSLALILYLVVNLYVLWHLDLFIGDYFNSGWIVFVYWMLAYVAVIGMTPLSKSPNSVQVAINNVGSYFFDVLVYLTITYLAADILYFICHLMDFDKRNLLEYMGGITLFVVVGVIMFGTQNKSTRITNTIKLKITSKRA